MEPVEHAALARLGEILRAAGAGQQAGLVLVKMIPVRAHEAAERPAGQESAAGAGRSRPGMYS